MAQNGIRMGFRVGLYCVLSLMTRPMLCDFTVDFLNFKTTSNAAVLIDGV